MAERVIVSQLHAPRHRFRGPSMNGKTHSFRIIPDRGSWYGQFDTSDMLMSFDRKSAAGNSLTTTFFRALASSKTARRAKTAR
jgi:DNA-directed RNA polymerase beta subunit